MRKIVIVIFASLSLYGCDIFKSNDQILTQNDWELVMKQVIVESKMIKYSKFSEPLLDNTIFLDFNENGILNIINDGKEQIYYWKWFEKENLIITVSGDGDFKGLYKIGDNLSSDFLFLTKQTENLNDNLVMLSFIPKGKN